MNRITGATALLLVAGLAHTATAGVIGLSGSITQSTQDGTGPATNNSSLNGIADGDSWHATLTFDGSILAPGTYNSLTNASLSFSDSAAGASELSFGLISLTISETFGLDQFSLFGCLTTGSACAAGNQLSATFEILAANLNSPDTPAIGLDQPHPLDLLEDDGTTDIQGSITHYSYTNPAASAPEPSALALLGCGLALLSAGCRKRLHRNAKSRQRRTR